MEELNWIDEMIQEFVAFDSLSPWAWPDEDEPEEDDEILQISIEIEESDD